MTRSATIPPLPSDHFRVCSKCKQTKPWSDSYRRGKKQPHLPSSACKECMKADMKARRHKGSYRPYYLARRAEAADRKAQAVAHLGGKCVICGYDKYIGGLDFHHLDPTEKDFTVAHRIPNGKWETLKAELDKCVLLCCRCHREVHAGITTLEVAKCLVAS